MLKYINFLVKAILLQSNDINALLENTIVSKFNILKGCQTEVLEKLAVWFLCAYDKNNLEKCNKTTMLMLTVLGKF